MKGGADPDPLPATSVDLIAEFQSAHDLPSMDLDPLPYHERSFLTAISKFNLEEVERLLGLGVLDNQPIPGFQVLPLQTAILNPPPDYEHQLNLLQLLCDYGASPGPAIKLAASLGREDIVD